MITEQIQAVCEEHLDGDPIDWNLEELHRTALAIYPVPPHINPDTMAQHNDADDVELMLVKGALQVYDQRLQQFTPEKMGMLERFVLLNSVDQLWQRHLTDLDILREGIGLVAYSGRDPLVEYQREAYGVWAALQDEIQAKVARDIFRVAPREDQRLQLRLSNIQAGRGSMPVERAAQGAPVQQKAPEPVRNVGMYDNVGRNDPCPCGSGKKFKYCHYREMQQQRQPLTPGEVKRAPVRRRR
jgi:preprotein translocase subunit SecA